MIKVSFAEKYLELKLYSFYYWKYVYEKTPVDTEGYISVVSFHSLNKCLNIYQDFYCSI